MTRPHRKVHPSRRAAREECRALHLAAGPGVVPVLAATGRSVVTVEGRGTLADLLAERGPQPEAVARGVGVRIAEAVSRLHAGGLVHGDVKPANTVFAPDDDLWLIDFDAAGPEGAPRRRGTVERLRQATPFAETLAAADDVTAIAVCVVECATGVVIDPAAGWDIAGIERLGCSHDLAADIALVLADRPPSSRVAGILRRPDDRLPEPPRDRGSVDPTPTIDIPSVALAGLDPIGRPIAAGATDGRAETGRRGWRRWARARRG